MADKDLQSEDKEKSGDAVQPKLRQIRPGKEHAIVVNGQQVVLFDAPKKISAKSEVVLPGFHLGVYDRVYLRTKENRFATVNLHKAYADSDSIVFGVPDFDNFLAEGDAVWIDLISTKNPEASGYVFPYLKYTLKVEGGEEEEPGTEKNKKNQETKEQGAENASAVKGLGLAGLAVAATGEAMTGLVRPGIGANGKPAKPEPAKDRLKNALKNRDRTALRAAIDEAKKNGDVASLKEVYKEAPKGFESALFEDALGLSGFKPKVIPETETADIPEYEESYENQFEDVSSEASSGSVSGEASVSFSSAAQGGAGVAGTERVSVKGEAKRTENGSPSTSVEGVVVSSSEASGNAEVGISDSVQANQASIETAQTTKTQVSGSVTGAVIQPGAGGQAQVSVGVQTQQAGGVSQVATEEVISKAQSQPSIVETTENRQEVETVSGVAGNGSGLINEEVSIQAGAKQSIQGGGSSVKLKKEEKAVLGPEIERQASKEPVIQKNGTGSATGGALINKNVSGVVDSEFSTIGPKPAVESSVQTSEGPIKNPIEKFGESSEDRAGIIENSQNGERSQEEIPEAGLKDQVVEGKKESERGKPLSDEAEALAKISPDAQQAALAFMAKGATREEVLPGTTPSVSRKPSGLEMRESRRRPNPVGGPVLPDAQQKDSTDKEGRKEKDDEGELEPGSRGGKTRKPVKPGMNKGKPGSPAVDEPLQPTGLPAGEASGQNNGQGPEDINEPSYDNQAGQQEDADLAGDDDLDAQSAEEDGGQKSAYNEAVADQLDKLAESKKLDAEIKQVTKEASLVVNQGLMEAAAWVWGTSIPSIGLSVLLGAIIGDFLWAFKTGIIKRALAPLLRTAALKKEGDKIAKQIKFSTAVKLNILAMNLVVAAILVILLFLIVVIIWAGCNYPVGKTPVVGYKLSIIGIAGGSSICEGLDGATNAFGGGDSGGAGASGSWACQPLSSGPASEASLANTCFGSNASKASSIAGAESGGDPFRPSGVDKCTVDGSVVSWGLFQINISAQNNFDGLNCRSAFDKMYTAQTKDCRVINKPLYDQCVAAAKDAQKNIQKACQMSNNGNVWSAWGANQKCGF